MPDRSPQPVGALLDGWTPPPRPERKPILGRTVRLEPLSADAHGDDLFAAFREDAEGRNWTYRFQGPFPDRSGFDAWLRTIEAGEDALFFAYIDLASGRALGMGALMEIAAANGSVEVGSIMFSPRMQKTRAASEAMFLKMQWAFEAGYRRYEWTCDAMNAASMASATRLGFSFEAIFRKATVNKGRNRDKAIFSCLDSEWPRLRNAFEAWLAPENFDDSGRQKTRLSDLTAPVVSAQPPSRGSDLTNEFGQPVDTPVPDWTPPPAPECRAMIGTWCTLEPLRRDHGPGLFEALSVDKEGRTWTYMPNGPFPTLESYQAWLESACVSTDPLQFAIVVDGKPLGTASYLRIAPAAGSIEVGYITYSPALQRSRAATETMYLMMKWAFDAGYRRYEWKCNALNAPSCRAAERLGFTYEGLFRQMMVVKGRNRDSAWYSITDDEWPAIRDGMQLWLAPENFDETGSQNSSLTELRRR